MSGNRGPGAGSVIVLALIFGVLGGGVGGWFFARTQVQEPPAPVVVAAQGTGGVAGAQAVVQVSTEKDAIVNSVAAISPSVVKIIAQREPKNWQEFWMSGGMIEGVGSGFIFEFEGRKLVLTNTHVLGDFTDFTLKFTDGRELKARPLGRKQAEDLAVLEMIDPPDDLVAASLGDSDKLKPGEWVIAVGNPFNFDNTVTVGVVSAVGVRPVGEVERKVIQTDAAINAGNSGGPLVDTAGNVIGINFAIFDPQRNQVATTVGIGFAIPINQAKELLYLLVHRGPYVGLPTKLIEPNSVAFSRYFGLATDQGLVVMGMYRGGPAHEAGLQVHDVIVAVDGEPATSLDALQKTIFKHKIGDTISFTIQRGNQEMEVDVVAGTAPDGIYF